MSEGKLVLSPAQRGTGNEMVNTLLHLVILDQVIGPT